jgi:hypothetical protein
MLSGYLLSVALTLRKTAADLPSKITALSLRKHLELLTFMVNVAATSFVTLLAMPWSF